MPEETELSQQNIKDRYYGVNDPVANKMLRRAEEFSKLTPPDDKDITTLYVGNVDATKISEEDLKYAHLSSPSLSPRLPALAPLFPTCPLLFRYK